MPGYQVTEAAKLLGVAPSTLRRWADDCAGLDILPDYVDRHPRIFSDADLRTLQAIIALSVPGVTRADLLSSIASGARGLAIPANVTPYQPPTMPTTEIATVPDPGAVMVLARSLSHLIETQAADIDRLTRQVDTQAANIARLEAMTAEQGAILARVLALQLDAESHTATPPVEPPDVAPTIIQEKPPRLPIWRRLFGG